MSDNPSGLIQFIGRLHPLLVHLPIGFILLLAAMEAVSFVPRFKHAASVCRIIIVLSVPVVIFSAVCGWLLSWNGGYDDTTLGWHKWLGTALVPMVLILAFFHWRGWMLLYRGWLIATVLLLTVVGHFGGSLTHGSDYLFPASKTIVENPPQTSQPVADNSTAHPVFATEVEPILKTYCVGCHGPEKSKGKLKLDSPENIFRGGDSGPVIEPGNPEQSLLIKRITLPESEDEHMPPSGKKQPTAAEIALLKWWVNVGAPVNKSVEDLKMPEAK